jgi:hypothetical protein
MSRRSGAVAAVLKRAQAWPGNKLMLMLRQVVAFCSSFLVLSAIQGAPATPDAVKLDFTPCGGMVCIPVTLADGRTHVLLLDTGNVNSWLVADTANTLGLKLDPTEQNGKLVPGIFRLGAQTVSLQGRALSGKFLALGREQVGELPTHVEGALAYTLFKEKVLEIDYPHRTVRMLDAQAPNAPRSGSELQLITFGKAGPPIVVGRGFSVDGKAVSAQIDTCYTGTLLVYDKAIPMLGLEGSAAHGQVKYFPYTDGGVNMSEADVGSITFGSYVLARGPVRVYFSAAGRNPVHQPDGLFEATVGNALLAHSVVTLDFHSMKIYVQPG